MRRMLAIPTPFLFDDRFAAIRTRLLEDGIETPFYKMVPHITVVPPAKRTLRELEDATRGIRRGVVNVTDIGTWENSGVTFLKVHLQECLMADCDNIRFNLKVQSQLSPHVTIVKGREYNHRLVRDVLVADFLVLILSMAWEVSFMIIYRKDRGPWLEEQRIPLT